MPSTTLKLALVSAVLAAAMTQGQLSRPTIGLKIGPSFSTVDDETRTLFCIGGNVAIPGAGILMGSARGDVDYFTGSGTTAYRFGISTV